MARYIDADKAVEEARVSYCKDCETYNGVKCRACGFDDAMMYIEDAPTSDVVEVVRCKDCKHFMKYSEEYHGKVESADGDCFLRLINSVDKQFQAVCCNDFCSYGERKKVE